MATDETDEAERARLRRSEVRQWKPALDYLGGGEYVSTAVEDCDGEYYLVDDVDPLLAELATLRAEVTELRERTRRRDSATEPPAEGEWVLGLTRAKYQIGVRRLHGDWLDENGDDRDITAWWPLPPTEE